MLLLLLGSDLHMMERLTAYDRPFFGRADNMTLGPRGRAVEPLIREALELTAGAQALPWPDTTSIGGWWNRQFDPEIDLVGTDRAPVAGRVHFTGSIKWLNTPFDHHDLHSLHTACLHVPGFDPESTEHAVVSLSGTTDLPRRPRLVWGPADVLNAWTATA